MDFILPSCPGIPDSMWIAVSATTDTFIRKFGWFFGTLLGLKLLLDFCVDVVHGQLDLGACVRTLFRAILIGIFLNHYKPILMFFDNFIDSLCPYSEEATWEAVERIPKELQESYLEHRSLLAVFVYLAKFLIEAAPKLLVPATHLGAIQTMRYIKAVTLIVMVPFGPLAAMLSLLPGPFKKSWSNWAKSYVHVTCWSITLGIFQALCDAFTKVSGAIVPDTVSSFFEETIGHLFLSSVLFVAIYLTPTWTSKLVGQAIIANIWDAINMTGSRFYQGGRNLASRGGSGASKS
jgi:hypothetical protein